jgi:hypothetical protein
MALVIVFERTSVEEGNIGGYNVTVLLNRTTLWKGRVEKHERAKGWQGLVEKLVKVMPEVSEDKSWLTNPLERK